MRSRRRRALARTLAVCTALVVLIALAVIWAGGSSPTRSTTTTTSGAAAGSGGNGARSGIAAAESGLLPWHLAAPISREVVLPGSGTQLLILGGLNGNTSASGVFTLDTATGALAHAGTLAAGLHDSAGTLLGGRYLLFGGGSPATVATVQAFTPGATGAAGAVIGQLPQPRSDDAAVTIGSTAYVVGGYDGTAGDPEVLSTTDGTSFKNVAALPVPVRYPAVAAVGNRIYVFGGQATNAAAAPVDAIQMVDVAAHRASVVGHLPFPVAGASAVSAGGHIYVAGGTSSTPQTSVVGVGTTQLTVTPGANPGTGASGASKTSYVSGTPSAQLTGSVSAAGTSTTASLPATASTPAPAYGQGPGAAVTGPDVGTIWAWNPATDKLLAAGRLQVPVSHAAVATIGTTAWLVGGEVGGTQSAVVQMLTPNPAFGSAGAAGAGSPYFGDQLLVADRGNNRLLLMDASMKVTWTYPSATSPPDPLGFYFPDDAFFMQHGSAIISNQEENETIVEIAYPSGKIIWSYGHPKQPGTAPGYLHEPDDAYLLKNGQVSVADAVNCRVLVINHDGTVATQIGTNGSCVHKPPTSIGSPNGDTPLENGDLLVSEINGSWVSEWTTTGQMVWTVHVPVSYPSDPQQLGPDSYLVADYAKPGALLEFNKSGQVLYHYQAPSGPGELDHPSLAEMLPSGAILINDDYANRMVAIDPTTGALVWQYGVTDSAGTTVGMLNTPDGFDVLAPGGTTPTHPATG